MMDFALNESLTDNVTVSWDGVSDRKPINTSAISSWLFSRLRIFLYLSDPYEESFEFVHQVADYHTEVQLMAAILGFTSNFSKLTRECQLALFTAVFKASICII